MRFDQVINVTRAFESHALKQLSAFNQWALFQRTPGRPAEKTPVNINGDIINAALGKDEDLLSFRLAQQAVFLNPERFHGIGFFLKEEDDFCCLEIQDCRDPESGKISPYAARLAQFMGSFATVCSEGTGLIVWARNLPEVKKKRRGRIRIYRASFIPWSGEHVCFSGLSIFNFDEESVRRTFFLEFMQ